MQLFRPEIAPDDYIAAKSMIDPKSVCIDTKAETCEGPWQPSALSGLDCIANFGYGQGSEQRCEENGGQMIDFDQENSPKVVFEELCYLQEGIEKQGEVDVSTGKIDGVIKNWGKSFEIEFQIERRSEGIFQNVWVLKGTLNGQTNKDLAKFMIQNDDLNYRIIFFTNPPTVKLFTPQKTPSPKNQKFKFVIKQSKMGERHIIRIIQYDDKHQIFFDKSFDISPVVATDVVLKLNTAFDSSHGTLSNVRIRSDPKCIFEDQSIQEFWYGGILIDGNLYTQSGSKLNDVTGVDTQTGVIDQPLPPKKLCFKMSKITDPALTDYFKIDTESIVDCEQGNATFLCWKKPNDCSSGGGYLFSN